MSSIEALNQACRCLSVDADAVRRRFEIDLSARGMSGTMVETHPHLFASLPVFVARDQLEKMARVIAAIEGVVESAAYRQSALSWAPEIARFDPGSPGGLLGYDFHLTAAGPKLIEINTNPGGVLINALLGEAQKSCCGEAVALDLSTGAPEGVEQELIKIFRTEWQLQRGGGELHTVAIVDEVPEQQYLYPEFQLFRQLLERNGIGAIICAPQELEVCGQRLCHRGRPIDLVYNRLTDFALQLPANEPLRSAYLAGEIGLSPHPRAHALYADKRNLSLLSNAEFLRSTGAAAEQIALLLGTVPQTEMMTASNRDEMWSNRRQLFFKPAAGYGSKAVYRGDKLTRRVWDQIAAGSYVAQALASPSERRSPDAPESSSLKVDIRNYAYEGSVKLVAARLYRGQTTNFRTPHGGFAPILTSRS